MAEIFNLRQARKRRRRADQARDAATNRLLHGRTAGERTQSDLERERHAKRIQAHRRELPADGSGEQD